MVSKPRPLSRLKFVLPLNMRCSSRWVAPVVPVTSLREPTRKSGGKPPHSKFGNQVHVFRGRKILASLCPDIASWLMQILPRWRFLVLTLLAFGALHAQPRPMELEDMFRLHRVTDPQISP